MKIRGQRECKACGTRWSYYETGSVSCPACGSLHSVGRDDDRALHTATADGFDLTPVRNRLDDEPLRRLAGRANDLTRQFTRGYGFISAGDLRELDETYVGAMELRHVSGELSRRMDVRDDEKRYFTSLLEADDGVRPTPEAVPRSMRSMRGLAYANAVAEYRSDLRAYLAENPDSTVDDKLERLSSHVRRVQALDGDIDPADVEQLLAAARELGRYLFDGGDEGLARAETRLDRLR